MIDIGAALAASIASDAITGATLGLTLIVAIGAQNAFVLRQGLRREHVGAIVAFCALADPVLMLAGVAGLAQGLGRRPLLAFWLTVGGAGFLLLYGPSPALQVLADLQVRVQPSLSTCASNATTSAMAGASAVR